MVMDTVEDGNVFPGAARTPAKFKQCGKQVGGFHEGAGDQNGIDQLALQRLRRLFFIASGFEW